MSKPVVEVHVRAIAGASDGFAVFLGNEEKVFVILVDQSVGAAIAMCIQGIQKERPLTHDLATNILRALGAKIERAIVNDLKLGTYYARLVLSLENKIYNWICRRTPVSALSFVDRQGSLGAGHEPTKFCDRGPPAFPAMRLTIHLFHHRQRSGSGARNIRQLYQTQPSDAK